MQRVSGPQLQVQLQNDGLGVLGVQQPGTPHLHRSAPISPEKIRGSKGAVKVPQPFAASGVRATQLICAIGTVRGSVAVQGGGKTTGGLSLGARKGAERAEARPGLGGRGGAVAFVCSITAFILTVAFPGVRETLPVPTEELI